MLGRPIVRHSPARMGKKRAKVATVMHEYGEGALKSSSGQTVTSHDQAVAIALSESGTLAQEAEGLMAKKGTKKSGWPSQKNYPRPIKGSGMTKGK